MSKYYRTKIFIDESMSGYSVSEISPGYVYDRDHISDTKNKYYEWEITPMNVHVYRTLIDHDIVTIPCIDKMRITPTDVILFYGNHATSFYCADQDIVISMKDHALNINIEPDTHDGRYFNHNVKYPELYHARPANPYGYKIYVRLNIEDHLRYLTYSSVYEKHQENIQNMIGQHPIEKGHFLINPEHIYKIMDIKNSTFYLYDKMNIDDAQVPFEDIFKTGYIICDKNSLFIMDDNIITDEAGIKYDKQTCYKKFSIYKSEMDTLLKLIDELTVNDSEIVNGFEIDQSKLLCVDDLNLKKDFELPYGCDSMYIITDDMIYACHDIISNYQNALYDYPHCDLNKFI